LLGLLRRLQLDAAPVADPVLSGQAGDLVTDRGELLLRQIGALLVQPLVALELLRPVAREVLEEVLARPRLEVEPLRPDPCGAGLTRGAYDVGEELGLVGESGQG